MIDWDSDEGRWFGCPTFIRKDVNEMSEMGLLSLNRNGHKYLVVGVQIDIPFSAFEIINLLDVSNVVLILFNLMMADVWIVSVPLFVGTCITI